MAGGWTGNSNPIPSVLQPVITSDVYTVGTTSTAIVLTAGSGNVIIQGDPNIDCYLNLRNGVCTTNNFKIPAGSSFQYQGAPILSFTMIAPGGPATVYVAAN